MFSKILLCIHHLFQLAVIVLYLIQLLSICRQIIWWVADYGIRELIL